MDTLLLLKAFLLGIIEGLTEFLPVSSTGHLIIFGDLMNFTGDGANTFEIFIQLGAVLGVAWFYHKRLWKVISGINQPQERRFAINILIAFMPAVVLGLIFHSAIKTYLFNPITVAMALIVGGILILIIERKVHTPRIQTIDEIKPIDALKVGFAQTLAMFPGVSRSGATIMGGLLCGLSRTAATEFSFFLAMPTMFAATVYDLYKSRDLLHIGDIPVFAVGFITAFFTALVVVKLFLAYVSNHNFTLFAWYRIIFGMVVLWYFW